MLIVAQLVRLIMNNAKKQTKVRILVFIGASNAFIDRQRRRRYAEFQTQSRNFRVMRVAMLPANFTD